MNKLYQYLAWAGLVLIVIVSVFFLVSIKAKLDTATTTNNIAFTGEGKVVAKPDVALIDFSIVTDGRDSKDAQNRNSTKSKQISDFLKNQAVKDEDIKTTGYNIYPQYTYPRADRPEISGYQVNQSFQVKIRDLDKVSVVLDGIVGAGANQVSSFRFAIDDPEKLKAEAREQAIADAKAKAQELENQLGVSLGRIINFSEGYTGIPTPPIFYDKAMGMGMGGGGGPVVPAGENEVTVSVTLTYQIK